MQGGKLSTLHSKILIRYKSRNLLLASNTKEKMMITATAAEYNMVAATPHARKEYLFGGKRITYTEIKFNCLTIAKKCEVTTRGKVTDVTYSVDPAYLDPEHYKNPFGFTE